MKELDSAAQKVILSSQKNKSEIQSLKETLAQNPSDDSLESIKARIVRLEQEIKTDEWDLLLYSEESQKLKQDAQEMMRNWILDQQNAIENVLEQTKDDLKKKAQRLLNSLDPKERAQHCHLSLAGENLQT